MDIISRYLSIRSVYRLLGSMALVPLLKYFMVVEIRWLNALIAINRYLGVAFIFVVLISCVLMALAAVLFIYEYYMAAYQMINKRLRGRAPVFWDQLLFCLALFPGVWLMVQIITKYFN